MRLRFSRKTLGIPYAVFLLFFVIIPMLVILFYAFTDNEMHLSFENFIRFFSDPTKLSTIVYSLVIALITTAVCLLIAYPVAYILARSKMKKKFVILLLFVTPMWINFVLRVNAIRELLSWIGLLGEANYFNTIFGMDFSREKDCPVNAALNYGYGILLSLVNREIVCCGKLTQLGIHHRNEFNQFNLSCDIMEPFRVVIDEFVYLHKEDTFDTSYKFSLVNLANKSLRFNGRECLLSDVVAQYVKSVFDSLDSDGEKPLPVFEFE